MHRLQFASVFFGIPRIASYYNSYEYVALFQTGYSVVAACVVTLRRKDKSITQVSTGWISNRGEGVICLVTIACCGFATGVFYRFGVSFVFIIVAAVLAILAAFALHFRHVSN